jgi:sugar O-acyltransferase (sialic acid O-acetyltransferase NeuD family)
MSTPRPLLVFGAGDIAQLAAFYFAHDGGRQVAAFTVDPDYLDGDSFEGRPLLAWPEAMAAFPPHSHDMFVALSYARRNRVRQAKFEAARAAGYALASYVSPRASVFPGVAIGDNCFVLEDNTVQPFVRIGNDTTLWSGNHIGHHSTIGDHCFLTSHVVVSGGVTVGDNCFIGVNATIRDHVAIGAHSVIGAGALILGDTAEHSTHVAAGTPAAPPRG